MAASAEVAFSKTTGTVQGSNAGPARGPGRGAALTSSGESSGAVRTDGSSRTASAGLPACRLASVLLGAAKGCGRADRSAWLVLATGSSESSAHKHSPSRAAQSPCSTSMADSLQRQDGGCGPQVIQPAARPPDGRLAALSSSPIAL